MARIIREDHVDLFPEVSSARSERDAALADIRAEYEKAVAKAAAVALSKKRGAIAAWKNAERQARAAAAVRDSLVREYQTLPDDELVRKLRLHEYRLSDMFRPRLTAKARRTEQWYVDMITEELTRPDRTVAS